MGMSLFFKLKETEGDAVGLMDGPRFALIKMTRRHIFIL